MPFISQGKTNLKYILIVVIMAFLAGRWILVWQRMVHKEVARLGEFPNITQPAKIKNETADWKIYRNEEYGFELKYHPSFETDFVAYIHDAGGANILGIKGPNWREGTDFFDGAAIFAKIIEASTAEEAAVKDRKAIEDN